MINPHGGTLINRIAPQGEIKKLEKRAIKLQRMEIENRHVSDCEMIAIGGFSPLGGFMDRNTVQSVLDRMELADGTLWAIPIVLPISHDDSKRIQPSEEVALYDRNARLIAIMRAGEIFELDLDNYCERVFKTNDSDHPGVQTIIASDGKFISGEIELVNRPIRENIDSSYFLDPKDTREEINRRGWRSLVAFQTRNPIHRAHEYLIKCAIEPLDGAIIHPLVGETKSDDIPSDVRMKCYDVLIENYFSQDKVILSVLPAAMHYAGPREAVHHMIVRKNYGCSHMIIGRDHAGIGDYYGTYEAQEFVSEVGDRLDIEPINFEHSFFCTTCNNMASKKTCPHSQEDHLFLSGTKVRAMLQEGQKLPEEFTRPEVSEILIKWATR